MKVTIIGAGNMDRGIVRAWSPAATRWSSSTGTLGTRARKTTSESLRLSARMASVRVLPLAWRRPR